MECEPIDYFAHEVPKLRCSARNAATRADHTFALYEVMQYPGQTMFIPAGWWHAVLNVQDCLALTQNFARPPGLDGLARQLPHVRRVIVDEVLERLESKFPQLSALMARSAHKKRLHASADQASPSKRQRMDQTRPGQLQ